MLRLRNASLWIVVFVLVCCPALLSAQAGGANPAGPAVGQTQPPIAPKVVDTPVPPPVTLPGPPTQPPDVPNRPLTADEAARIALRNQPAIAAARGSITAAQGVTQQARAGLLPFVAGSASYTHTHIISGNGTSSQTTTGGSSSVSSFTGFSAAVSLQQLIFDFNHTRDLVRQDVAFERAATQFLSVTQQSTVFQVKQAFYQYAQFRQLVGINEANVANRQNQLALANARLQAGLGLPADVVTAQTAVSVAVQGLTVARNSAEDAHVNLALQMGIDPRTPIEPAASDEPPVTSDDVNSFVQAALQQRPEILQAQANIQAFQYSVSAAKTFNAPILSGSVGTNARGNHFWPQNDNLTVGVAATFTLYDGGQTAGRVKQARGNLETAQAQLTSAQLTVTSDVSQAYLNLRSAEQRVTAAVGEVANAQEGVRIATGRYRAGIGQFLDILNAQQFLITAQTDQATALYGVQQARAALARATGAPIPGR